MPRPSENISRRKKWTDDSGRHGELLVLNKLVLQGRAISFPILITAPTSVCRRRHGKRLRSLGVIALSALKFTFPTSSLPLWAL
jgi:hypothetical protein